MKHGMHWHLDHADSMANWYLIMKSEWSMWSRNTLANEISDYYKNLTVLGWRESGVHWDEFNTDTQDNGSAYFLQLKIVASLQTCDTTAASSEINIGYYSLGATSGAPSVLLTYQRSIYSVKNAGISWMKKIENKGKEKSKKCEKDITWKPDKFRHWSANVYAYSSSKST